MNSYCYIMYSFVMLCILIMFTYSYCYVCSVRDILFLYAVLCIVLCKCVLY